jgi:hypothetical protein
MAVVGDGGDPVLLSVCCVRCVGVTVWVPSFSLATPLRSSGWMGSGFLLGMFGRLIYFLAILVNCLDGEWNLCAMGGLVYYGGLVIGNGMGVHVGE